LNFLLSDAGAFPFRGDIKPGKRYNHPRTQYPSIQEGTHMTGSSNLNPGGKCTLDVRRENGAVLVKCKGRLVHGQTGVLKEGVKDLLLSARRVVVDLGGVDYMDSTGLGAIVQLYVSAKASHCELQLLNLGPQVWKLFGMANILSLFEPCGEHNIRMP
jgi:anti-anti-sigma factor